MVRHRMLRSGIGALGSIPGVMIALEVFALLVLIRYVCYLRHVKTNTAALPAPNPHRPFSAAEVKRREQLISYLDSASEDELIEEILLPLFRQLGFFRITNAGHKDKALEYGKGRVDEVHAADNPRAVFRYSGQEGEDRRCRSQPGQ
jgi:hypothetical protein